HRLNVPSALHVDDRQVPLVAVERVVRLETRTHSIHGLRVLDVTLFSKRSRNRFRVLVGADLHEIEIRIRQTARQRGTPRYVGEHRHSRTGCHAVLEFDDYATRNVASSRHTSSINDASRRTKGETALRLGTVRRMRLERTDSLFDCRRSVPTQN